MVERVLGTVARQLREPHGSFGRVVGWAMDNRNDDETHAAARACEVAKGAAAADLGFGGGLGLRRLPKHVGADGQVFGVEPSEAMLARARRRFSRRINGWPPDGGVRHPGGAAPRGRIPGCGDDGQHVLLRR